MFRWWRGGRRRHLLAMAACIALALLCRGTTFALPAAAAVALIALRLPARRRMAQDAALDRCGHGDWR